TMDTNKVKGGELGKKIVRFWDCLLDRGMFRTDSRASERCRRASQIAGIARMWSRFYPIFIIPKRRKISSLDNMLLYSIDYLRFYVHLDSKKRRDIFEIICNLRIHRIRDDFMGV